MNVQFQYLYLNHDSALPGDWTAFDADKLTEEDCAPVGRLAFYCLL